MSNLISDFVGTYSPAAVNVILDGNEVFGFAEGDFVTVEKNEPRFNTYVGAKGETTRVVNHDNNYTVTIRLQHNSPFCDYIEKMSVVDNVFKIPPVFQLQIKDPSSYDGFFSSQAWLNEDPSRAWGSEEGVREYVFFAVGGITSDDAVSGALNIAANKGIVQPS